MRFFFYFNDRGQENGGLAFCLAIDRGKCYNKMYAFTYFYAVFLKKP